MTRSQSPKISSNSDEIMMIVLPCFGQLGDDSVNLGLGADVNAARRFVENDNFRVVQQPFGQHHFLLVAAAQGFDDLVPMAGLDAELFYLRVRRQTFPFWTAKSGRTG